MNHRIFTHLILLLCAAPIIAHASQTPVEKEVENKTDRLCLKATETAYAIDTRQSTFGVQNFREKNKITVLFTHLNPFSYDYVFSVTRESADLDEIKSFAEAIKALPATKDGAQAATANTLKTNNIEFEHTCKFFKADQGNLPRTINSVSTDIAAFQKDRQTANELHGQLTGSATRDMVCGNIVSTTVRLRNSLFDANAIANNATDMRASMQQTKAALEAISETNPVCDAPRLKLIDDATKNIVALDSIDAVANELATRYALVSTTLQNPSAFTMKQEYGAMFGSYEFDISFQRKEKTAAKFAGPVVVTKDFQVGQQRFFHTYGLGYSFADKETFGRESTIGDEDAIQTQVARKTSGNLGAGLVTQLNMRLGKLWWHHSDAFWGLSVGAAVTNDDSDTDLGYFGGAFVAFTENVFVTAGYGEFDTVKLSGGFDVGDTVPTDFEGDIPTIEESEGAFLVTLTFRFE